MHKNYSTNSRFWKINFLFIFLLCGLSLLDLTLGSFSLSFSDVWNGIFHYDPSSQAELTARIFRVPRVVTALLAGAALSVSGLLLQTLFQNPLAGPYVLGINSGSALFVAISTMLSFQVLNSSWGLVGSAMLGAMVVGFLILASSLYIKNKISLLLIGIMLGSFAGALVSVIQAYADPNDLKTFMLWSFGSLQVVGYEQIGGLSFLIFLGIFFSFLIAKPLNLLLIGDKNASLSGVKVKQVRFLVILITSLLTGMITAYCGPIAFIGLIVPNVIKYLYKTTNHFQLLLGSLLGGALLLLICDITMQLASEIIKLPLNAMTALIGAPVVVWIIVKRY